VVRWLLVALLATAGVGHFTAAEAFRAQVPTWMPWPEFVIAASGVVELALAGALAFAPVRHRPLVGWVAAAFFVLGWLAVPDEIRAARSNSGVARIILLHTARTILPIVAFIVALIWHRHQRPVQRRSVQNLLSSIALGWLWLIVLYLVWRLVPP